ncbi:hypothetical protein [Rhizobium sp. PL01]|uniref:hypothetical protein n=1 Tax=Rhizobium sp. PL01 TaxID=3085631 RepID=UPI0029826491|nr:hypothetical protein [Rhizobium sp. PL01]MDW5315524.1 hypothetical protein [Rhizobium sp. PL01]
MVRMGIALVSVLALFGNAKAQEADTLGWFMKGAYAGEYQASMVFASGETLASLNSLLKDRGEAPLYCPPPALQLTSGQYVSILANYLKSSKTASATDDYRAFPIYVREALSVTFPCKV